MLSGLSLPVNLDRSRNKERLEASLAGLLELQFLRQRQEFLVKEALQIAGNRREQDPLVLNWDLNGGDTFYPGGSLRDAEGNSLRRHLNGLRRQELAFLSPLQQLERQVSELRLDVSQTPGGEPEIDSRPSSAEPLHTDQDESLSYADSDYVSSVPRSFSATHSESLEALADMRSKHPSDLMTRDNLELFPYPGPLHAMAVQNPLLGQGLRASSEEKPFSPTSFLGAYRLDGDGELFFGSEAELAQGLEPVQSKRLENYITGLVHKRVYPVRSNKPRTSLAADPTKGLIRQSSLCQRNTEPASPQSPGREQVYPSSERAKISSSHSFDGSLPTAKYRPLWNTGGDQSSAKKILPGCQASDSFTGAAPKPKEEAQHSQSLRKQVRLMTNTPPMRPTSLEYHDLNYHPALRASPQESYYQNVYSLDEGPRAFPPTRANSVEVQSPPFEQRIAAGPEVREKRSPIRGLDDGAYQMVNAQYIPGKQPYRGPGGRAKAAMLSKCRSADMSPEAAPPGFREKGKAPGKKCRFSEEAEAARRSGRKPSPRAKKTSRSNSENSLLHRQSSAGGKYNTVERDEGRSLRSRRHPGGGGGYRRWRSTAEISQEEATVAAAEPYAPGEGQRRLRRYQRAAGHQAGSDSEGRAPPEDEGPGPRAYGAHGGFGDSESSLSEAESPAFSTCSSETDDEGGGLVWPQQVAPQAAGRSPAQPKVFVKIKASHALKKKILRFRTGSLKVMTTV
ncbi:dapper homolog 1-like isoform X2 [Hypanus sabinus]|uniref:dapper homolog 1-like isoform X2 n=1 Tax=Hypanus sabinus TaxID=79690 RepID=UPI0028C473D8|nr:dapper homolog 1-like isoform X2 [Hypanus sabinus]